MGKHRQIDILVNGVGRSEPRGLEEIRDDETGKRMLIQRACNYSLTLLSQLMEKPAKGGLEINRSCAARLRDIGRPQVGS